MYDEAMRRAISLAGTAPRPHPNPRVGALVLDRKGRLVAEAAHEGAGRPHAEALALGQAGARAVDGTVIVTLEPCDHQGRTPPCTDALIDAGVARVVFGATDPDGRVDGLGMAKLKAVGIEVIGGVLASEAEAADPGYFHHRRTGRPRVTLKTAATLDGQTAAADGTSQWITSAEARADAHALRAEADAVIVGAGTVLADDPRLNVRLPDWDGPQPLPVVIAGARPLPPDAKVFARKALVYGPERIEVPAEVVATPAEDGSVDLAAVVDDLGERAIVDVLVEGGATLATAFFAAGLVDRAILYLAAKVAGGLGRPIFNRAFPTLSAARDVEIIEVRAVGPDLRIEFVALGSE